MARFGQALKASKASQQLSKASAPHNPPLALPSYLPISPSNCFYWASKLLHGTFWPGLKTLKSPTAAFESPAAAFESLSTAQPSACFAKTVSLGLRNCYMARFGHALKVICFPQFQNPPNWHHLPSHNPPLALPSYLPIGPTNCFYWASKLLYGTFWPGLKTLKSPAAAFESLSTAQPSACFAIVPPHRPFKLFLLGFETATWHVLASTFWQALKASKVPQQLSKASAPHNPPLALPSYLPIGPTNCFYWASKLLHGTFWPGLKSLKSPAAAFESLSTAQPSACFAIVPPHRPFKLFLLGFETATWHVLARP